MGIDFNTNTLIGFKITFSFENIDVIKKYATLNDDELYIVFSIFTKDGESEISNHYFVVPITISDNVNKRDYWRYYDNFDNVIDTIKTEKDFERFVDLNNINTHNNAFIGFSVYDGMSRAYDLIHSENIVKTKNVGLTEYLNNIETYKTKLIKLGVNKKVILMCTINNCY